MSDEFIKVSFQEEREGDPLIGHWLDQGMSSAKPTPRRDLAFVRICETFLASRALVRRETIAFLPDLTIFSDRSQLVQKLHPNHSLVVTQDSRLNLLAFPDVSAQPISPPDLVTNTFFASLPKSSGITPGIVYDSVEYGAFKAFWKVSVVTNFIEIAYSKPCSSGQGVHPVHHACTLPYCCFLVLLASN
jgi:hypothetical protein